MCLMVISLLPKNRPYMSPNCPRFMRLLYKNTPINMLDVSTVGGAVGKGMIIRDRPINVLGQY